MNHRPLGVAEADGRVAGDRLALLGPVAVHLEIVVAEGFDGVVAGLLPEEPAVASADHARFRREDDVAVRLATEDDLLGAGRERLRLGQIVRSLFGLPLDRFDRDLPVHMQPAFSMAFARVARLTAGKGRKKAGFGAVIRHYLALIARKVLPMNREDVAGVLASLRLFRGADPALLQRIAQQPRARRRTKSDEAVYEAGEPADAIFVAFPAEAQAVGPRGIVELTLPAGEASLPGHVEHVVEGDAFGEFEFVAAGLVDGRTVRRSSARTLTACDLYRIPFALLAPVIAEVEAIRGRLIRLSMERLISALNVKATHFLGDRDIALANWLLDAADNVGIAEGRHVRFSRPIGQRDIAEALGVSRETISLRLNEWERAGLLNTGGQSQRFEILDYPRVALRASRTQERRRRRRSRRRSARSTPISTAAIWCGPATSPSTC